MMTQTDLQGIANLVLRRAEAQGFVIPRDIRSELAQAGRADTSWKEVLHLIRPSLHYKHGRYYYISAGAARMRDRVRQDQQQHRNVERAVRQLIHQYRHVQVSVERREQVRIELVRPVRAQTDDHRLLNLLTRDLSLTGLRLLSSRPLQTQKLRVWVPKSEDNRDSYCFLVQVLWTAPVGDDLYETGGLFLEVVPAESEPLKLVDGQDGEKDT